MSRSIKLATAYRTDLSTLIRRRYGVNRSAVSFVLARQSHASRKRTSEHVVGNPTKLVLHLFTTAAGRPGLFQRIPRPPGTATSLKV